MLDSLALALALASLAALSVPAGAALGRVSTLHPGWLEDEARHGVIAFGGGALLAAVALVLVPEGADRLPGWLAVLLFAAGGAAFAALDWYMAGRQGPGAQFVALLTDFLPEAAALGALLVTAPATALVLAAIVALQNVPEAFNAWREMQAKGPPPRMRLFWGVVPLGPAAALLGHQVLQSHPATLGAIMIFAAGGIVYLVFEDIAPSVPLENHWLPPLGAILGFALGLAGHLLVSG